MRKLVALLAALPLAAIAQQDAAGAAAATEVPTTAPAPTATPALDPRTVHPELVEGGTVPVSTAADATTPAAAATPAWPPPPHALPPAPFEPGAATAPPARRARGEKERGGWYIGFGVGSGSGVLGGGGASVSFPEYAGNNTRQMFLNFKVGGTLSPQWLLGFDLTSIYSGWDGRDVAGFATITNYDAVATFFPASKGFFLRVGLGLSTFSSETDAAVYVDDGAGGMYPVSAAGSGTAAGMNLLAGAGYAFWLGDSFNLTVNLDVSGQGYGAWEEEGFARLPEQSVFWALYAGFDWY